MSSLIRTHAKRLTYPSSPSLGSFYSKSSLFCILTSIFHQQGLDNFVEDINTTLLLCCQKFFWMCKVESFCGGLSPDYKCFLDFLLGSGAFNTSYDNNWSLKDATLPKKLSLWGPFTYDVTKIWPKLTPLPLCLWMLLLIYVTERLRWKESSLVVGLV